MEKCDICKKEGVEYRYCSKYFCSLECINKYIENEKEISIKKSDD